MYTKIPADIESKMPSVTRALGLSALYMEEIPIPIAIPAGVVKLKKEAIMVERRVLKLACEMQLPRARPSKN